MKAIIPDAGISIRLYGNGNRVFLCFQGFNQTFRVVEYDSDEVS